MAQIEGYPGRGPDARSSQNRPGAYDATSNPGGVDVVSMGLLPGEDFAIYAI